MDNATLKAGRNEITFKRRGILALAMTVFSLSIMGNSIAAQDVSQTKNEARDNMNMQNLTSGRNDITFKSQGYTLAAHLYTPEGFDPSGSYPAIVISSAFNQVKEQAGAVYGQRFAERGYVAIAFDHVGYGDSEGEIRNYENAFIKMESIRDAVSFMGTLPFVDRDNLFGLGVCASSGYMAAVAADNPSMKKLALVAPWLHDPEMAEQIYGGPDSTRTLIELGRSAATAPEEQIMVAAASLRSADTGFLQGLVFDMDRSS